MYIFFFLKFRSYNGESPPLQTAMSISVNNAVLNFPVQQTYTNTRKTVQKIN